MKQRCSHPEKYDIVQNKVRKFIFFKGSSKKVKFIRERKWNNKLQLVKAIDVRMR